MCLTPPPLIPVSLQLCFLIRNCAAFPERWRMRFGRDFPDTRKFTGNFCEMGLIAGAPGVRIDSF